MVKLIAWKCDICGKECIDENDIYSDEPFYLAIRLSDIYENTFKYNDVCADCRYKLNNAIENCIELLSENTKIK